MCNIAVYNIVDALRAHVESLGFVLCALHDAADALPRILLILRTEKSGVSVSNPRLIRAQMSPYLYQVHRLLASFSI